MTLTLDPATTELPVLDEPVDAGTRREFLAGAGVIAVLGLAACGGGDETPAADATRLVRHSAGTTDVPARPTRIVALGGNAIAAGAIALGLTPVAAPEGIQDELAPFAELLPAGVDLQGIESAGEGGYEPNLEAIATLGPEIIVADDGGLEEEYPELSQIAPTVLVPYGTNGTWRARFRAVAQALGRDEGATEIEADYERLIAELPDLTGTTVAFLRPDEAQFRLEGAEAAFPGSVARDAGIPTFEPEGVGTFSEGSGFVEVSAERLDVVADADLIVVSDRGGETSGVEQFEANPLWERLAAVREGRALSLPQAVYNGGSHYAATLLARALAGALR